MNGDSQETHREFGKDLKLKIQFFHENMFWSEPTNGEEENTLTLDLKFDGLGKLTKLWKNIYMMLKNFSPSEIVKCCITNGREMEY